MVSKLIDYLAYTEVWLTSVSIPTSLVPVFFLAIATQTEKLW